MSQAGYVENQDALTPADRHASPYASVRKDAARSPIHSGSFQRRFEREQAKRKLIVSDFESLMADFYLNLFQTRDHGAKLLADSPGMLESWNDDMNAMIEMFADHARQWREQLDSLLSPH